ncbi:hypothetical protein C8Q77DRAFT_1155323 [Trametes polyzona]|nr:hypothetical protein C8Q77DRAFT_1155323 [Trametes polyzona]
MEKVDESTLFATDVSITQGNYMLLSSIALFYYDYLTTLSTEARLWWGSRLSLGSTFYILIRYGSLLNITLVALFDVRLTPQDGPHNTVSRGFYDTVIFINLFIFATVSAFVSARMFALWNRNWSIAVVLFLLGLINPNAVNDIMVLRTRVVLAPWPVWGCEVYIPDNEREYTALVSQYLPIIVSSINILYELSCLLLTVCQTFGLHRAMRGVGQPSNVTALLLRDGSVYFIVMTGLSVMNITAAAPLFSVVDIWFTI